LWAKKLACFPMKAFPAVQAISLSLRLRGLCVRILFLSSRHGATAQREKRGSFFSSPQERRGKLKSAAASRRKRRTQLELLFIFASSSESLDPGKAGGRWNRVRKEGLLWAKKFTCFHMKALLTVQAVSLSLRLRGLCVTILVFASRHGATAQREKRGSLFSSPQERRGKLKPAAASRRKDQGAIPAVSLSLRLSGLYVGRRRMRVIKRRKRGNIMTDDISDSHPARLMLPSSAFQR
jgi:hypothetical protein